MSEETQLLAELMLQAAIFCSRLESLSIDKLPRGERSELRLKIAQCRGALENLQGLFDEDELTIANPRVRSTFRQLVISLLWATFQAGPSIDRKLFRKVVQIESGFTYLLLAAGAEKPE